MPWGSHSLQTTLTLSAASAAPPLSPPVLAVAAVSEALVAAATAKAREAVGHRARSAASRAQTAEPALAVRTQTAPAAAALDCHRGDGFGAAVSVAAAAAAVGGVAAVIVTAAGSDDVGGGSPAPATARTVMTTTSEGQLLMVRGAWPALTSAEIGPHLLASCYRQPCLALGPTLCLTLCLTPCVTPGHQIPPLAPGGVEDQCCLLSVLQSTDGVRQVTKHDERTKIVCCACWHILSIASHAGLG